MSLHTSDPGGELVTRFRELMRASGASVGLTAALVEVGIRHGLHLIALSGFGMDPPENAAMTALCARLLLDDPSLTLAVGGADLLSLHIAHGVCYDTRADLRKVLSGHPTPPVDGGILTVQAESVSEASMAETDYNHLARVQNISVDPSQRADYSVHKRLADCLRHNGVMLTNLDLTKLKRNIDRRVVRRDVANGLTYQAEEDDSDTKGTYIMNARKIEMLAVVFCCILGREVEASKYPGTAGTLLVSATHGGGFMRCTVTYTVVMSFFKRIIEGTGNFPTSMAPHIVTRALAHLNDSLHRWQGHPELCWEKQAAEGNYFEPNASQLSTLKPVVKPGPPNHQNNNPNKKQNTGDAKTACHFIVRGETCPFGGKCRFSHKDHVIKEFRASGRDAGKGSGSGPKPPPGPPPGAPPASQAPGWYWRN
jgi:hypothetical protein